MLSGLATGTASDQDADESTNPIPIIDPVTNPIPVIQTLRALRNPAPAGDAADAATGAETVDRYARQAAVLAVFAGLVLLAALLLAVGVL